MKKVGVFEAKVHFSELLDEVSKGEIIQITKHGVGIANLIPFSEKHTLSIAEASQNLLKFRKSNRLNGLSIKALKETGQR